MLKVVITFIALFSCVSAFGWGAKGHQIVAYAGSQLTLNGQDFWQANLQPMQQLSTVPDRVWKAPAFKSAEGPNHWFQIDAYYSAANYNQVLSFPSIYTAAVSKYSEPIILRNGTAPWRIRQLYQLALLSFKTGDMKSGLEFAGALSHYVADLSQPLHASENYDGQLTGNHGIHSYFETSIIKDEVSIRTDVLKRAKELLKDVNFIKQFQGNLAEDIFLIVARSIEMKDVILKNDTQYGRGNKAVTIQLDLAKDRMADGAASLAIILSQLWSESGLIAQSTPLRIQDPQWLKPEFDSLPVNPSRLMSHSHHNPMDDHNDCAM